MARAGKSYRGFRSERREEGDSCSQHEASNLGVLQLLRRRSGGEAIGRTKASIGSHGFFYTGMPPLLGGRSSCSNMSLIHPWGVSVKAMDGNYLRGKTQRKDCGGCMEQHPADQLTFPTRPSFSTAHRKRSEDLSHVRKTLNPGVPVLPLRQTSFEVVGQWPVCRAGASPTEEPCVLLRLENDVKANVPMPVCHCQIKDT